MGELRRRELTTLIGSEPALDRREAGVAPAGVGEGRAQRELGLGDAVLARARRQLGARGLDRDDRGQLDDGFVGAAGLGEDQREVVADHERRIAIVGDHAAQPRLGVAQHIDRVVVVALPHPRGRDPQHRGGGVGVPCAHQRREHVPRGRARLGGAGGVAVEQGDAPHVEVARAGRARRLARLGRDDGGQAVGGLDIVAAEQGEVGAGGLDLPRQRGRSTAARDRRVGLRQGRHRPVGIRALLAAQVRQLDVGLGAQVVLAQLVREPGPGRQVPLRVGRIAAEHGGRPAEHDVELGPRRVLQPSGVGAEAAEPPGHVVDAPEAEVVAQRLGCVEHRVVRIPGPGLEDAGRPARAHRWHG